jgi:hypothetical protein
MSRRQLLSIGGAHATGRFRQAPTNLERGDMNLDVEIIMKHLPHPVDADWPFKSVSAMHQVDSQ